MRVVIDAAWKVWMLARFKLQEQGLRSLYAIFYYYGLALSMHIDQRHLLLFRHVAKNVGIFSVDIDELAVLVESPPHHRRHQHNIRLFAFHIRDKSDQIFLKIFWRRVPVGAILGTVIVAKLDKYKIAFF